MTPAPALSVRGLTKRYGDRTVVDELSIELPRGVVAGFVGPNGAGKTTTMAMLLGLVAPSAGEGEVLGRPITSPASYLPEVGALVESPAFYPALTGAENLRYFARVGGHDPAPIPSLLALVGLDDRGDDRYRSYSLGMKQRLGIAAALLGDPALLILDEPSNGLDPQGMREMRALIRRIADGRRTVLVSSHVLSELEQVCDWLVLIDTGRSLYQGPASAFLATAGSGLAVAPDDVADLGRLASVLSSLGGVSVHDDHLVVAVTDGAVVNRAAWEAGLVLARLEPVRSSLEDRYLSMLEVS